MSCDREKKLLLQLLVSADRVRFVNGHRDCPAYKDRYFCIDGTGAESYNVEQKKSDFGAATP